MKRTFSLVTLVAGLLGTGACVGAMVLAIAGVAGAGAAVGMAGMGSRPSIGSDEPTGIVGFLVNEGPAILLLSVAAFALSLATKRAASALAAVVAGGLLYWGMYGQDRLGVMYASIIIGLLVWGAAWLWSQGLLRRNAPQVPVKRNGRSYPPGGAEPAAESDEQHWQGVK